MKLNRILYLTSLISILLLIFAACGGDTPATTAGTTAAPDANLQEEDAMAIDLFRDGKTEYTIVYDDKNSSATDLKDTFLSIFQRNEITVQAVPASSAEADYGKEIVIGNVRPSANKIAAMMKSSDFAAHISGDDWVLMATDETNYDYLAKVLNKGILSRIMDGIFSVTYYDNLIYSTSAYAETTYAEYIKKGTRGLTQEQVEALFVPESFTASDRTRLPYRLYLPSNYDPAKKYPVLIFLHGAGERGNGNDKQLVHVVANLFNQTNTPVTDAIIICPQCPDNNQWVDTPWANGSYSTTAVAQSNESKAVLELLDKVAETYSTDSDRYYIMGISMGGFGTWDIIMRNPDKFAAAVPICGGADPSMAEALKDHPIYTTHSQDDNIVPVSGTDEMVNALLNAGSTAVKYDEITGKGHGVWDSFTKKTEVLEWLFSQKLSDRKS